MRSRVFHDEPLLYDGSVVERYAALQSLDVADPVRFELETLVLSADQLDDSHRRVVEAFHQHGVTVYLNSCLLHDVNDTAAAMRDLSSKCRRFGFEFHHLYVAGAQTQRRWNSGRPVDLDTIIGIATELRRNGSGRELPRLVISTELGEVDFGPGCHIRPGAERGTAEITLWPYTLDCFRAMDPAFSWPDGVREEEGVGPQRVGLTVLARDQRLDLPQVDVARLLLLEDRRIGRAGIGQRRRSARAASFGELALAKGSVLLFFLRRCSLMASPRGRRDGLLTAPSSPARARCTAAGGRRDPRA